MWEKLYEKRPWDLLIYIQHKNVESYRKAVAFRAIEDIKKQTLAFIWKDKNSYEAIEDYKNNGASGEIFKELINRKADYKWSLLEERKKVMLRWKNSEDVYIDIT